MTGMCKSLVMNPDSIKTGVLDLSCINMAFLDQGFSRLRVTYFLRKNAKFLLVIPLEEMIDIINNLYAEDVLKS